MTLKFSLGEGTPDAVLAVTQDWLREAAEGIAQTVLAVQRGELTKAQDASAHVKALRAALELFIDERNRVEKLRKQVAGAKVYKHVGVYAYRRDFLLKYAKMQPTMLEQVESLEQLRALENGYKIKVLESAFQGVGVDTQEDLDAVNKLLGG